jgi:hypothetical protein
MKLRFSAMLISALHTLLPAAPQDEPVCVDEQTAPRYEVRKRVEKTVGIRVDDSILIHGQYGMIQVGTWSEPSVSVKAEMVAGADTRACAESCLGRLSVQVEPEGRRVLIRTVADKGTSSATKFQVNMIVLLPDQAVLTIENEYGDISVSGLRGAVKTDNRFGRTSIDRCASADVTNAFGDVNVAWIEHGVQIRNRFGSVSAHDVSGPILIANEAGAVRLMRGSGTTRLENRLGEVNVSASQGRFVITSSRGPVVFQQRESGPDTATIDARDGTVRLTLPMLASALVSARAGRVRCDQAPWTRTAGLAGEDTTFCYQFGEQQAFFSLSSTGADIIIDTEH